MRALALLLALVLTSCTDTESPLGPTPAGKTEDGAFPSLSISDGANGGNEHFYFLPPLVRDPKPTGIFDAGQSPVVEICELTGDTCSRSLATYTVDAASGEDRVRADSTEEYYWVNWGSGDHGLSAGATARVQVRIGAEDLGHLDILLTRNGGTHAAKRDQAKVELGTRVSIRFRIEVGALPAEGDIVLHDNVVPIDSTVLRLVSTEPELAAGTYRFDVLGKPVPGISAGDVIAGPQGLGFMRIVTSVKVTGKKVVAETTQADLSDIIKEGWFEVSGPLDFSGGSSPSPSGSVMAPSYSMASGAGISTRLHTFDNDNLCALGGCPEWLSLTLPSGYVDLSADVSLVVDLADSVKATVKGDLVFDVTARAVAEKEFTVDGEGKLAEVDVPLPRLPFPLTFVKLTARVRLKVGYDAAVTATALVQSGIHLQTGVELGGLYLWGSGWTPVWQPTFQASIKEARWAAQGDGHVRVYVRPEVQIIVQGVEGPYMGIEPYLKAYGSVGTEDCRGRLTRGTDAEVVLQASYADKFATDTVKRRWPGDETEMWNEPIPCGIGRLKVVTNTSGTTPDPDGYTVTLDGIDPKPIGTNASVVYSPLPPAIYKVELTGLADNCSVTPNPREIVVSDGDTTLVAFPVTCGAPAVGSFEVNTATTGEDDGFMVLIDGGATASQPMGTDEQFTFYPVVVGDHTVELTDLGPSCSVEGENPRTVTVPEDATISTDFNVICGFAITFMRNADVWQINPDGTAEQRLTFDGGPYGHVSWSPDGSRMVFSRAINPCEQAGEDCFGSAIFIADANGFNVRQLTSLEEKIFKVGPEWSPDGTRILFGQNHSDPDWKQSVMVMNADGTNVIPVRVGEGMGSNYAFPSWTPDGRIIYVERVIGDGTDDGYVSVMNADGSGWQRLTFAPSARIYEPFWVGNHIVFRRMMYLIQNQFDLMVMDPDGSNLTNLSNQQIAVSSIEPSPDGRRIAYVREDAVGGLWLIDVDGSNQVPLAADGTGQTSWRKVP